MTKMFQNFDIIHPMNTITPGVIVAVIIIIILPHLIHLLIRKIVCKILNAKKLKKN